MIRAFGQARESLSANKEPLKPPPTTMTVASRGCGGCAIVILGVPFRPAHRCRSTYLYRQTRYGSPHCPRLPAEQKCVRWPVSRVLSSAHRKGMAIPLGRSLPNASRDPPGRRPGNGPYTVPIWSCSRWGLPCRVRCRPRGALLPHRFTLASAGIRKSRPDRRFVFCGAIPGVTPAGRYPAPYLRGARTFLQPSLAKRPAAIRPSDARVSYHAGGAN